MMQLGCQDTVWADTTRKGESLVRMMRANALCESESAISELSELEKWGYTSDESHAEFVPFYRMVLEALNPNGQFTDEDTVIRGRTNYHAKVVSVGGKEYQPSYACFEQAFSPKEAVMFALYNRSPFHMIQRVAHHNSIVGTPTHDDLPGLRHWSDVAFIQWLSCCREERISPTNLKYVCRCSVENLATLDIIHEILCRKNLDITVWPGVSFDANTEEGMALLASPNGSGVAYLLSQHRAELGHKVVERITVFREHEDVASRNLLFHIVDYTPK
ncbi:hypothetical protein BDV95DRAFT_573486 [Massariosphaeria phaeospora]|uniref:Uncharacterized protein n=1 Tax=Massariosphaeria phaeospora TaxID=100035 RepID=A0A7C8MK18_9PLEO|nr:hypothetical protein BDV95DRAFT_573486 [Massariosphaeria phaeospora]